MKLALMIETGDSAGRKFDVPPGQQLRVGRATRREILKTLDRHANEVSHDCCRNRGPAEEKKSTLTRR